jgi:hypothetical protein
MVSCSQKTTPSNLILLLFQGCVKVPQMLSNISWLTFFKLKDGSTFFWEDETKFNIWQQSYEYKTRWTDLTKIIKISPLKKPKWKIILFLKYKKINRDYLSFGVPTPCLPSRWVFKCFFITNATLKNKWKQLEN